MQIPQGAGGGPKPGPMPAVQVVGFHVEGASPSPGQPSMLHDSAVNNVASSPTLVIIPPSFQSVPPKLPTASEGGAGRDSSSAGGAPPMASAATQAPSGTEGAVASASTSTTGLPSALGGASTPPAAIPAPLTSGPAPSGPSGTSTGRPGASLPKPIYEAERSEALHRGLVKVESTNSMTSDVSSMSTMSEQLSMSTAHLVGTTSTSPLMSPVAPPAPSAAAAGHKHSAGHKQAAPAAAPAAPAASAGPGAAGGPPVGKPQGPPGDAAGKKPAKELTRAERRAIQDAQRAAKAAQKAGGPAPAAGGAKAGAAGSGGGAAASAGGARPAAAMQPARVDSSRGGAAESALGAGPEAAGSSGSGAAAVALAAAAAAAAGSAKALKKAQGQRVVSLASTDLFTHLQQYKKVSVPTLVAHRDAASIHPAVLQLGLRYADGTIQGANARCVAMLHALSQVISDYRTPEGKSLNRDLTSQFNTLVNFLVECRPLSVSMGNAIKHIKLLISKIDPSTPEAEAKADLIREIADFINVRIHMADTMIVQHAAAKIDDGDVIMTYAYSHVVSKVLLEAASRNKRFRVVVVDARPEMEGRQTLQKLLAAGVACDYVHFNAMSYSLREVTKVFLGAAAVMSNGTVMGRAGSAAVAMMAHALSKPVLICCESYKFHERVQLDSITHNELGDPDELTCVAGRPDVTALAGWQEQPRLGLLNLKFDAMPAEYVTMIVTEFGMIPPTSVPVILREYTLARQENV